MPSSPSAPLRKKLFYGWWIVLAGFCLQMLQGALLFHGFGAYILPLQGEFGWKRAEISGVFSMVRAESGLLGPLQGWLISRFGPRCIMQVGMTLFGAGFWLLAEIDSLISLYLSFALIALGASLGGFMSISSTIANWFVQRRSIALGLMLAGMGMGGVPRTTGTRPMGTELPGPRRSWPKSRRSLCARPCARRLSGCCRWGTARPCWPWARC